MNQIYQIKNAFKSKNFQSIEEAAYYAQSLAQEIQSITKANNDDIYVENLSPQAIQVIENMKNIKPNTDDSPDALRVQLKEVIRNSNLSNESEEYIILNYSVDIAIEVIYYAMELSANQAMTKSFWDDAWSVVKCIGGTAGSAGLGAIGGASVGTISLPVIGTVSGTALGGWSGALVGVATFC